MPPRYPLEEGRGLNGQRQAFASVEGDLSSVEERVASLEADQPYSAAVPADWSGSAPASVKEALDRLAAALGPIP